MGFRMRKSMKIAPGVRLSVSKSGVGASVGGKGGRCSVHSSGRRTTTVGSGVVPGVYYQSSKSGGSRQSGSGAAAQQAAPPSPKKPGMFAPKGEKELYKAIKAQDVKAIKSVGVYYKDFLLPSYSLAGLMMLTDEPAIANPLDFSQGMPPSLFVSNTDSLGEQIQRRFPQARVVKTLNTMNCEVMVDPGKVPGKHRHVLKSVADRVREINPEMYRHWRRKLES